MKTSEQIKGAIRNISKKTGVNPNSLLQMAYLKEYLKNSLNQNIVRILYQKADFLYPLLSVLICVVQWIWIPRLEAFH